MLDVKHRQVAHFCLLLSLLSTAAMAQPELPPMPELPPIESLAPVTTPAAQEKKSEPESLRDKSAAIPHPDWGAPPKAAEVGELPPLPPLPGMEPEKPAVTAEVKKESQADAPAVLAMPDMDKLPPIDLPASPNDIPNHDAPPPPPPAETAAAPAITPPEMPPMPALPSEPAPALPPLAETPPAAPSDNPLPPMPEVADNAAPAPATANTPPQPLTVPELPDLPDFTSITEPEGKIAAPVPVPAPPVAEPPKENMEVMPAIADLLKDKPASEPENPEQPPEIAENEAKPAEEKKDDKPQEIVWPKDFKIQTLPPQIYRPQYAYQNTHLPHAQYYQQMELHMFHATAENNLNGMRALMQLGVPATIRSAQGETLLSHAVRYHAYDAARLLLALGMNPNEANPDGSTPLHYAAQAGRMDVVDALMRAGADPRTPDMNGISPLQVAQIRNDQRMMAQLNYSRFGHGDMQPAGYATYMR